MRPLLLSFLFLLLGACVTTPPDPSVFDSAERAIEAAERAGAEELSPTELRFARDRLELARTAVDNKKYDEALMAIERSEINSELAIEKSRAAIERRRVNELRQSNELLREELIALYGEEFVK